MLVRLEGRDSRGKIEVWVNPEYVAAVEDRSRGEDHRKRAFVHLQGAGILVEGMDALGVVAAFEKARNA